MSSEAPPTALVANKYEIIRLVGRGGMGAVWEGRHNTLGTRVAVKFIDSEFADRPDVQKRFETEAKSAATIQSKHAIQIYDHGIGDDGRPYIVMEYLEGEPLDGRLNRVHTMDLPTTTRILQQVARALAKAHERGIIHRDLKPENIFLVQTLEDDEEIAKVLDFGIAKIIGDQAGPLTGATKTGAILGTPFYMSPEQARGLKEVDQRADVWSLGVIAFRSVVGKLPFDGQSVGDLLVNICTADPPIPSQELPGLPAAFDGWIKRSLARSLDERFPNVGEQMEALAFAAGVTVKRPISSGGQIPNSAAASSGGKYRHTLPLDSSSGSQRPPPVSDGTPLPIGHVTSTSLSTVHQRLARSGRAHALDPHWHGHGARHPRRRRARRVVPVEPRQRRRTPRARSRPRRHAGHVGQRRVAVARAGELHPVHRDFCPHSTSPPNLR